MASTVPALRFVARSLSWLLSFVIKGRGNDRLAKLKPILLEVFQVVDEIFDLTGRLTNERIHVQGARVRK